MQEFLVCITSIANRFPPASYYVLHPVFLYFPVLDGITLF
jgi:hypothetical protein